MALLINRELVEDGIFFAEFRRLGGLAIDAAHPAAAQENRTLRQVAERNVITFVLLRQRAEAAGVTVSPRELEHRRAAQWGTSSASVCGAGVVEVLSDQLLVEKYCQWITRHEPRPSRAEVEAFYRSHREQFLVPEQVRVQQVVRNLELPGEEAAAQHAMQQAEEDLNRGAPFRQVADRYSDCGPVELGWVSRGEMVPSFEAEVFALERAQRSRIFRTQFGLHLAVVLERKAAGLKPFEEVRAALAKQLLEQRRQQRIEVEITAATHAASITIAPGKEQVSA